PRALTILLLEDKHMKKYLALVLSMMLVLGAMAMAAPQDAGKAKGEKKAAGGTKKMGAMKAMGTVESKTDTELTGKGKDATWTFATNKDTKWNGDVKTGSNVTVMYTEKDGKKWATSVTAKAAKAAGGTKKAGSKKPA